MTTIKTTHTHEYAGEHAYTYTHTWIISQQNLFVLDFSERCIC